ncbi:MAG: hypothetical protein RIQ91_680, partial [Bacteroidota bacterium]
MPDKHCVSRIGHVLKIATVKPLLPEELSYIYRTKYYAHR